LKPR